MKLINLNINFLEISCLNLIEWDNQPFYLVWIEMLSLLWWKLSLFFAMSAVPSQMEVCVGPCRLSWWAIFRTFLSCWTSALATLSGWSSVSLGKRTFFWWGGTSVHVSVSSVSECSWEIVWAISGWSTKWTLDSRIVNSIFVISVVCLFSLMFGTDVNEGSSRLSWSFTSAYWSGKGSVSPSFSTCCYSHTSRNWSPSLELVSEAFGIHGSSSLGWWCSDCWSNCCS